MTDAVTFCDVTLPLDGFQHLADEASAAGHNFLTRMSTEWTTKSNRFSDPGECLIGAYLEETLVAIGGLNSDPYEDDARIGRLRHVYVSHDYRRRGIAGRLVRELFAHNTHFGTIRLRTPNSDASRFYESIGFSPIASPTATHTIIAK